MIGSCLKHLLWRLSFTFELIKIAPRLVKDVDYGGRFLNIKEAFPVRGRNRQDKSIRATGFFPPQQ